MRKTRKLIPYNELTENKKDEIIEFITQTGTPISKVSHIYSVSVTTMNRIFDERFNKREKKFDELKNNCNLETKNNKDDRE